MSQDIAVGTLYPERIEVPATLGRASFAITGVDTELACWRGPAETGPGRLSAFVNETLEVKTGIENRGLRGRWVREAWLYTENRPGDLWLERVKAVVDKLRFRVGTTVTIPGTGIRMTAITRFATVAILAGLSLAALGGTAEAQENSSEKGDRSSVIMTIVHGLLFVGGVACMGLGIRARHLGGFVGWGIAATLGIAGFLR